MGALDVLVVVQLSVLGVYFRPVFKALGERFPPPHKIISVPVQTTLCPTRSPGPFAVVVALQVSSIHAGVLAILGTFSDAEFGAVFQDAAINDGTARSRSTKIGLARH